MTPRDECSSGEVSDLPCLVGALETFNEVSLESEYLSLSSNFEFLLLTIAPGSWLYSLEFLANLPCRLS